jgi:hypothetical protein
MYRIRSPLGVVFLMLGFALLAVQLLALQAIAETKESASATAGELATIRGDMMAAREDIQAIRTGTPGAPPRPDPYSDASFDDLRSTAPFTAAGSGPLPDGQD